MRATLRAALAAAALLSAAIPCAAQTPAATINGAGTITAGSTFQTILAALGTGNVPRRSVTVQNNNTNGDNCWLYVGGGSATKATSILLAPGGSYQRYYPYVPSDALQMTCATTSDTFYLETQ